MSTESARISIPTLRELRKNKTVARLFGITLGLIAWMLLASIFPAGQMPYPYETFMEVWALVASGVAFYDVGMTLWRTFWGFLGAVVLGSIIGILMGTSRYGQKFLTPYAIIGLSVPAVAWAAVCMLIFGFSNLTPIVATIVTTFPYITINVWKGVENIDLDLVRMSNAFDLSYRRIITQTVLPNTAPQLFTAARLGLAISWKVVTIAEMFSGNSGVGYRLITAYDQFQFEQAWAWAVLFMIIILMVEYGIMKPLERRFFEYRNDVDYDLIY